MRIGITGATGLIGGAFCRLAAAKGHDLIVYTRRQGQSVPQAMETWVQPANAPHALPETPLDALVHLAGESLIGVWTPAKRDRIWKSRVDLTRALVRHLGTWKSEHRPKVLVCASGIGFYGSRGDDMLDETCPRGSGFLAELCEQWEAAARAADALGIRVVNLRSGMVLGKDGGAFPMLRRIFRCGFGGRLGGGRQWMSWIHIRDEAGLILWAVETEAVRGPLNLCTPHPVTNADFTKALAGRLHRPAFMHVPSFPLRLLLRQTADEMLLCSQRAFPRAATDLGYRFTHPDLESALAALA